MILLSYDLLIQCTFDCNLQLIANVISSGERPHTRPLVKSEHLRDNLDDILVTHDNYFVPTLYYEILDLPLSELETKKVILVQWQNKNTEITVCIIPNRQHTHN